MFDNGAALANGEQSMTALAPSWHKAKSKAMPPCVTFGSSNEFYTVHQRQYRVLKNDFKQL
jgi:hypothetical protein